MQHETAVTVSEKTVTVFAGHFIKHDGYTYRLASLFRVLHQLSDQLANKTLVFTFDDGEPLEIVAFGPIISDLVATLGLDADQIVFQLVDHVPKISIPFHTKLYHTRFFRLAENLVKTDSCSLDGDHKLFGAFFGRFTLYRMLMAHYLETKIGDHSLVAFQSGRDWAEHEIGTLHNFFNDAMHWLANRQHLNTTLQHTFNGCIRAEDCLPVYHEVFGKYAIEIVIETNVHDVGWFTEKTTKCLAAGKPFLLLGTSGQIRKLKAMGFKTFDGIIDESYDLEHNLDKRFDAICREIARLACLPSSARQSMVEELYQVANHNKTNYTTLVNRYYQESLA
jgi:hypothetical protein